MPIPVKCTCGSTFTLKDEYAGKRLRCPSCGAELQAGQPVAAAPGEPSTPGLDRAFDRDKFLLRQQHFAISEKYYVNDEQGNPIIFVQRPAYLFRSILALIVGIVGVVVWLVLITAAFRLMFPWLFSSEEGAEAGGYLLLAFFLVAFLGMFPIFIAVFLAIMPKRHIGFYRDDTKQEQLLEVLQDTKWQIPKATYTLRDTAGHTLARFTKNYLYDIFRKRWVVHDSSGREAAMAKEDSILLSMLRRFLGPLFGALRTNFIIVRGVEEQVIGEFNRKFTLLDRYVLDLSADPRRSLDRRVALALGVLLDTGERR